MKMNEWTMLALAFLVSPAFAQTGRSMADEYEKQIKSAEVVGALGTELFGEQVNFYTGSTSFVNVDVSLGGNNALPVNLVREYRMEVQGEVPRKGMFADWDIQVPHLQGVFHLQWQSMDGSATRCSNPSAPPKVTYQGTSFDGPEYWSGAHLHLPGGGSQEMLKVVPENPHQPTGGLTYPWVTNNQWYFSCFASADASGEGFLAHAPDGTRYWFDWLASRAAPPISKGSPTPALLAASKMTSGATPLIASGYTLPRREIWLLPTRVEDRFGNTVIYTYDAANRMRLTQVTSSDGRSLVFTYNASGYVGSVTDGARTWTYEYTGQSLTGVVLPDGRRWQYGLSALNSASFETAEAGLCGGADIWIGGDATGTMIHPSGAQGLFVFRPTLHGRSYVTRACIALPGGSDHYARFAKRFATYALKQKTISGPGLPTYQWQYTYGTPNDSYADECGAGCVETKTVEITGPGKFQRYTFGNRFQQTDGKLLKLETGASPTAIQRTEVTTYQLESAGQPYPVRVGRSPYIRSDRTAEPLMPLKSTIITQQGSTFRSVVNGYDQYARAISVTKSSAPSP
ncbi:RHS repeat domain-containing protein [Pseudoxanthomonas beigongshangi]